MQRRHHFASSFSLLLALVCAVPGSLRAEEVVAEGEDSLDPLMLEMLELEDLMDLGITSVSKREEKLLDAAAAIYVLTSEDIRRSGVTTIAEALRLVPGMHVSRSDANKWAISARGFSTRFADKMLVLIDGRSVYTPFFGGVYWEVQDTMLEDVDRIEVIRGPGGTLWGANAVNGVVNVITKSADETLGVLTAAGMGNHENRFMRSRFGGSLGDDFHYRAYAKYFDRNPFEDPDLNPREDDWMAVRGGFRADWNPGDRDSFTFQGDWYEGDIEGEGPANFVAAIGFVPQEFIEVEETFAGGNLLSRWTRELSETSELSLQFYWDRTQRETAYWREHRDTLDVDFQHRFMLKDWNETVWGTHYRMTTDHFREIRTIQVDDPDRRDHLFGMFVQNKTTLWDEHLWLTVGTKLEHNNYTGYEYQPSGRLVFKPHPRHVLWLAASRVVRTPTRAAYDVTLEDTVLTTELIGVEGLLFSATERLRPFEAESLVLVSHELGYRMSLTERISLDLALYYNNYRRVSSAEPDTSFVLDLVSNPRVFDGSFDATTEADATTYGGEVILRVRPFDRWRLETSYAYYRARYMNTLIGDDQLSSASPAHRFHFRSTLDLPWNFELDAHFFWVGNAGRELLSYRRLDVRVGWKPHPRVELSLAGQNLTERQHGEFSVFPFENQVSLFYSTPSIVPRTYYGQITFRY